MPQKSPKRLLAGSRADAVVLHRCPVLLAVQRGVGTRYAQTSHAFIVDPLRCSARFTARAGKRKLYGNGNGNGNGNGMPGRLMLSRIFAFAVFAL